MKAKDLNPGHYGEAVERLHCINVMIDQLLIQHPVGSFDPLLLHRYEELQALTYDIYQEAGQAEHDLQQKIKQKHWRKRQLRKARRQALGSEL